MHDRRYVSVHVACGFTSDENVLPNAWIANKKGAEGINGQQKGGRGYHERYVRTCRFLKKGNPARFTQLAAAVCTEQHQNLMEGAPGGDKATARS